VWTVHYSLFINILLTPRGNNHKKDEPQPYDNKVNMRKNIHGHFLLIIITVFWLNGFMVKLPANRSRLLPVVDIFHSCCGGRPGMKAMALPCPV
jgi:hypothetical protein